MTRRDPTPPPPDDEPRYLTVVHPYPLNANLEVHADRRALALWLACCTGKDVLLAMFHKPTSPGMVLIEVDRDFESFDQLLGMHTWSEFLQEPSQEQLDKVSKVFYCTYNTGRLVEKHGWKRVNIEERWFNGWKPDNAVIRYPYPKTSYCPLPSEAKTGAPLCRPLPQKFFPVPPPQSPPPVGSAGWLAGRNVDPTASPTPSYIRKGRRVAPSGTASVTSGSSRGANSFSPPPPSANGRGGVWSRGPPRGVPSGRGPTPASQQSRTSERFEVVQRNNPPARSLAPSRSSNPARRPPYDPDGPPEPSRVYEYTEEDQPKYSVAAAMSDTLGGDPLPPPAPPSLRGSSGGGARPPGIDDPEWNDAPAPADTAGPSTVEQPPEPVDPAAPWAVYGATQLELPIKTQKRGTWTCSQHGAPCSPGICKERARFEAAERMRIKREEWERKRIEREERNAKKKKKEAKREKDAEAMGLGGRQRPPHHRGNTNSSNRSETNSDDDDSTAPPEHEDWPIAWEDRDDRDTVSVVSSARDAWNSVAKAQGEDEDTTSVVSSARDEWNAVTGSDDEEHYADGDDELSVARSANTNTNTNTSSSGSRNGSNSNSTLPASVISSARGRGRPPTRQSARDVRSTTSSTPSVPESIEPTESGFSSRAPSVSAAGGSDNGARHSDTRSTTATRSGGRSSVSSSSARGQPAPSITASSTGSGFPTFADTHWGDPIAMAMADAAKEGRRDRGRQEDGSAGEEGPGPSGSKLSKSARRKKNTAKSAQVHAQVAQVNVLEQAVLDVELPPGGPGSTWGDPNEAW